MNLKNLSGLLAIVLLFMALIGTTIGASNNVSLLAGLACFNWITFQSEQIKDRLK